MPDSLSDVKPDDEKNCQTKNAAVYYFAARSTLATRCAKDDCPSDKKPGKTEIFIRAAQETASFAPPEQESHSKTIIGGDNLDKVYWSELDAIQVYWAAGGKRRSAERTDVRMFPSLPVGSVVFHADVRPRSRRLYLLRRLSRAGVRGRHPGDLYAARRAGRNLRHARLRHQRSNLARRL